MGLTCTEGILMMHSTTVIQYQVVTDRQTDRQADRQTYFKTHSSLYTVSQKTHQLRNSIAQNYMDRFWWYLAEYWKGSRTEFACFCFHTCLLVITLSFLKLHPENNTCMLFASVSFWVQLFLQHLRRRFLQIICSTDDQWIISEIWNFSREISVRLFGGSEVCRPDSATVTQLCWHFHEYAHRGYRGYAQRTTVDCYKLQLLQLPVDAVLRSTFVNCPETVINCQAL